MRAISVIIFFCIIPIGNSYGQVFNFPCDKDSSDIHYSQYNTYSLKKYYERKKAVNFNNIDFILVYKNYVFGIYGGYETTLSLFHIKDLNSWVTYKHTILITSHYKKGKKIITDTAITGINYSILWDSLIAHEVLLLPDTKLNLHSPASTPLLRNDSIIMPAETGYTTMIDARRLYTMQLLTPSCQHTYSCYEEEILNYKYFRHANAVQFGRLALILDKITGNEDKFYKK